MKKLLFGFGLLAMVLATATISSCGETESTDEKTEVKEGEDGKKSCSKDKECKHGDKKGCDKKCSKECKEACKKFCTEDCKDGEHSDECKAACKEHCATEMKKHCTEDCTEEACSDECKAKWEAEGGKTCNHGGEHKCEEGKCGHGEEEGAEHKCSDMKCEEGKCGHGEEEEN